MKKQKWLFTSSFGIGMIHTEFKDLLFRYKKCSTFIICLSLFFWQPIVKRHLQHKKHQSHVLKQPVKLSFYSIIRFGDWQSSFKVPSCNRSQTCFVFIHSFFFNFLSFFFLFSFFIFLSFSSSLCWAVDLYHTLYRPQCWIVLLK